MFNLVPRPRNLARLFRESMFPEFDFNWPSIPEFKVDIRENEKEYIVEADFPGFDKEDLYLEFRNNHLIIGVKKQADTREEKENYLRQERSMQSMARSFYFDDVNDQDIKAKYDKGVLTVTLPKKEVLEKKYSIEID